MHSFPKVICSKGNVKILAKIRNSARRFLVPSLSNHYTACTSKKNLRYLRVIHNLIWRSGITDHLRRRISSFATPNDFHSLHDVVAVRKRLHIVIIFIDWCVIEWTETDTSRLAAHNEHKISFASGHLCCSQSAAGYPSLAFRWNHLRWSTPIGVRKEEQVPLGSFSFTYFRYGDVRNAEDGGVEPNKYRRTFPKDNCQVSTFYREQITI